MIHKKLRTMNEKRSARGAAVAAVHAGTGYNQVADPGQTAKGLCLSAHRDAETADLSHTARNERCLGVVTIAKAVCDSGCQGNDIL